MDDKTLWKFIAVSFFITTLLALGLVYESQQIEYELCEGFCNKMGAEIRIFKPSGICVCNTTLPYNLINIGD